MTNSEWTNPDAPYQESRGKALTRKELRLKEKKKNSQATEEKYLPENFATVMAVLFLAAVFLLPGAFISLPPTASFILLLCVAGALSIIALINIVHYVRGGRWRNELTGLGGDLGAIVIVLGLALVATPGVVVGLIIRNSHPEWYQNLESGPAVNLESGPAVNVEGFTERLAGMNWGIVAFALLLVGMVLAVVISFQDGLFKRLLRLLEVPVALASMVLMFKAFPVLASYEILWGAVLVAYALFFVVMEMIIREQRES